MRKTLGNHKTHYGFYISRKKAQRFVDIMKTELSWGNFEFVIKEVDPDGNKIIGAKGDFVQVDGIYRYDKVFEDKYEKRSSGYDILFALLDRSKNKQQIDDFLQYGETSAETQKKKHSEEVDQKVAQAYQLAKKKLRFPERKRTHWDTLGFGFYSGGMWSTPGTKE